MPKIFVILTLLYYSVKASTDYAYEEINEFIPKTFFEEDISKRVFKYHLSCKYENKKTSIHFQSMTNAYFYILLYDDYNKIDSNKNYTSIDDFNYKKHNITFGNLTCNKDYFFVINKYYREINIKSYYQFYIFNEETKIFNISPSLSHYYTLFPRNKNKTECFYYNFTENQYALITYDGFLEIKENDKIIYNNTNLNLFEFKKGMKYDIYYKSDSPIHFQFYNESSHFKYDKDFPMLLYGKNNEYNFEIDISDYKVGDYILLHAFDKTNWHIKYQYKGDFSHDNYINLAV